MASDLPGKVVLEFGPDVARNMVELAAAAGCETVEELITRSLATYRTIVDYQLQGDHRVMVIQGGGVSTKLVGRIDVLDPDTWAEAEGGGEEAH